MDYLSLSLSDPSYHVAHNMLHVISARRVARDLHTIVPWSLERTCWRQLAVVKISICAFQCDYC